MKNIHIFTRFSIGLLVLALLQAMALALIVTPTPPQKPFILTACPFNLTQLLWYDVCGTPVSGINVYYNISNTTLVNGLQPEQMFYPPGQTLAEVSPGVYENATIRYEWPWKDYFWRYGSYTAFTKATDTLYLTFDKKTFYIHPDFPFFKTFFFSASPSYFNLKWNGSYNITPGSCVPDRDLSIECSLNGKKAKEIDPAIRHRPGVEYISTIFTSLEEYKLYQPGLDPKKPIDCKSVPCSYKAPDNIINCISHDPWHPWLFYHNNISFWPIHFEASYILPTAVTLGQEFALRIGVANHGLFADNYTIHVESTNPTKVSVIRGDEKVAIEAACPIGKFPSNTYECFPRTASFDAKILPLIAGDVKLIVTVNSSVSGITLRLPEIEIKSGIKALSEFDLFGVLQIAMIATLILIFSKKFLLK